jgi:hypothetical protein
MRKLLLATIAALALACVTSAVMPAALAQTQILQEAPRLRNDYQEISRFVPSGKPRNVFHFTGVAPDCSVWNVNEVDVQLTKAPEHGTVEFIPGEAFTNFVGKYAHCSGRKYRGTTMRYKSSAGFTALDEVEVFLTSPNGQGFITYFKINVR